MFNYNPDQTPLVSVITPNYNGERFIRRVVESVRLQNFSVEHIIVDDCSKDSSWDIVQELQTKYHWIKAFKLNKNAGPIVARNAAIKIARGRFLAFLDVDDFWLPEKLNKQINFMISMGCALSFSDYRLITEDGFFIGRRLQGFNTIGWHLHHMTRYLGCLTIVIDRKIIPEFIMPEISKDYLAEDFFAWSNCIAKYGPALRCPYDLSRYTVVKKSRSSNQFKVLKSVWMLYRDLEKIKFPLAVFYFICYTVSVLWKKYRSSPKYKREFVDKDFIWTILN
jgi:teichuronic acid biosynthesis glycosyltransferase TuaG